MESFLMKINFPAEVTHDNVISIVRSMGFKSLGGYAELNTAYGKGARYLGNCVELTVNNQAMRFTLVVEGEKAGDQCLELKAIEWKATYVTLDGWPIEVFRNNVEKYFFKDEKDTIDWLRKKSVYEQARLSVIMPGKFNGTAISFMEMMAI